MKTKYTKKNGGLLVDAFAADDANGINFGGILANNDRNGNGIDDRAIGGDVPAIAPETVAPLGGNAAARLAEIAANVHAKNTTAAYESDRAIFAAWLESVALPCNELSLLQYLTELSETAKESTLRRKYVALRHVANVTNPAIFRTFFKGVAKTLKIEGKTLKQARAMHKDNITEYCAALDGNKIADIRNKALFLLCYYGAFRSSELVALRWSDIAEIDKGLKIHIDGKTGAMDKFIAYKAVNCPVAALDAWRKVNGVNEYVFVKVDKGGNLLNTPLTRQGFNKIIKGFNGAFSSHSFRRGFVSDAFKVGASIPAIQAQTGHKLVSTVVRYCEKDITANNAVNLL